MKRLMRLTTLESWLLVIGSAILTAGILHIVDTLMIIGSIWMATAIVISQFRSRR